jgi:hypothetical protein
MTSLEVRRQLVDALRLDLVGPSDGIGTPDEILPQPPSRWYLTGFLVPLDADTDQRAEPTSADEVDEVSDSKGLDDASVPEPAAARLTFLPSSIGLSVLVNEATRNLRVVVRWGDYRVLPGEPNKPTTDRWQRVPREEQVTLDLPDATQQPSESNVPKSNGLRIASSVRPIPDSRRSSGLPRGVRSVSLFLVNRRAPDSDITRDTAFAFQAQLEVISGVPLVPRPNLRSLEEWDEQVADLQYSDAYEFAVGHKAIYR